MTDTGHQCSFTAIFSTCSYVKPGQCKCANRRASGRTDQLNDEHRSVLVS